MKKYELLKSNGSIIRVLDVQQSEVLIIDCMKRTMPVWVDISDLDSHASCSDDELMTQESIDNSLYHDAQREILQQYG